MPKLLFIILLFLFGNLAFASTRIGIGKLDFNRLIEDNQNHPLVKASREILSNSNIQTDLDHNKAMLEKGLCVHPSSRVNNVIPTDTSSKLVKIIPHSVNNPNPMPSRVVNFLNLYKLKGGERKGRFLGANILDFIDVDAKQGRQKYIASEAPYHKDDYFRMVIDTKAKVLVSLTNPKDDSEQGAFPKIRLNVPVNLHHLSIGEEINVDGHKVTNVNEIVKNFPSGKDIIIKVLQIAKGDEVNTVHHITYLHWPDGGPLENAEDLTNLITTIKSSENELSSQTSNPIIVNCGYGYGRTGILILMHQLSNMLPSIKTDDLTGYMETLYNSVESKIALGAPLGVVPEKIASYKKTLSAQAKAVAAKLLEVNIY